MFPFKCLNFHENIQDSLVYFLTLHRARERTKPTTQATVWENQRIGEFPLMFASANSNYNKRVPWPDMRCRHFDKTVITIFEDLRTDNTLILSTLFSS
ncbi:hypothetical protein E2C01_075561 [Portunus trituberculatus]|uniref:Uncharacterized protein n=1 Tax=Portunus trituberculatus TaxID=210409 RepID=A0A5B7IB03_PORTR|nr:hypothetical protein [Portunus trituberculatus]